MIHDCDLCGSSDAQEIESARRYTGDQPIHVCMNCGFCYVRERRSAKEVADAWNEMFTPETYSGSWPAVQARLTYVAEWCRQHFAWDGRSILEIGAGEGHFLRRVREMGAYPVGLEPSPHLCNELRRDDIQAYQGTIEDFKDVGKYDVVCILWTLENCTDCLGMLRKARKALHPDGRIVVATGSRILVPFKKPLSSYFSTNLADTHCFRFSGLSLQHALFRAGFSPIAFNLYEECDWLVAVAQPTELSPPYMHDDPQAVLDYFAEWDRMFP